MTQLTFEDISALLAIIAFLVAGITGLIKLWIINPIKVEINLLNSKFDRLNNGLEQHHLEFNKLLERVAEHDQQLIAHREQIHNLYTNDGLKWHED